MSQPPERLCSCPCGCTVPIYVLQGEQPDQVLCYACRNGILLRGAKCYDGKPLDEASTMVRT